MEKRLSLKINAGDRTGLKNLQKAWISIGEMFARALADLVLSSGGDESLRDTFYRRKCVIEEGVAARIILEWTEYKERCGGPGCPEPHLPVRCCF